MKRNKYKDYLWYTALAVFIICVIEGIFFYHNVDNPFLKVTLNIQNAIKAYKIDPDIKQKEAIAYMQATGGGILSGIITYVYCIAVIVAPFCTIGALTVLIRKPASYVRGLFSQKNKKRVLVIGEGKYKFPLIDALTKDCRVRYNMLYEIISRYKADKNIVVDDKFMLSEDIEERLKKDSIELKENKKISEEIDEVWHNKGIFDRESSIAQSLHQDIKKWIIYEKHAYSLTDNREELERIEHRRWNIFMITHGFKYEKAERKDMYAKTHPCISKWEVLKVEKSDTLEYDFTPYYILKADR